MRRGRDTDRVFSEVATGERWYRSFEAKDWEVEEVPVSEIETEFKRNKRWKMIEDRRGYLIQIPNIYAYEFYLLKR